jgi:hypothetical protein
MKKIVIAVSTVIAMTFTTQVHAWGDREQGALAGLIVGAIAQRAFSQPQQNGYPPVQQGQQLPTQQYPVYIPQPQIIVQAPPVIYQPQPMREQCYTFQERDIYGRFHGHRTVCRMVPSY